MPLCQESNLASSSEVQSVRRQRKSDDARFDSCQNENTVLFQRNFIFSINFSLINFFLPRILIRFFSFIIGIIIIGIIIIGIAWKGSGKKNCLYGIVLYSNFACATTWQSIYNLTPSQG